MQCGRKLLSYSFEIFKYVQKGSVLYTLSTILSYLILVQTCPIWVCAVLSYQICWFCVLSDLLILCSIRSADFVSYQICWFCVLSDLMILCSIRSADSVFYQICWFCVLSSYVEYGSVVVLNWIRTVSKLGSSKAILKLIIKRKCFVLCIF